MEDFARDLVAKAHLQLESPLAMPVLASLGALLFSMVALYACAVVGRRKAVEAGGSMLNEQGLRRSTRAHKPPADRFSPSKQLGGSPTVAKTPKAQKTPRALKKAEAEAVTVTPRAAKPRSRAAKTPATAEPTTARTRRGAAKTPAH